VKDAGLCKVEKRNALGTTFRILAPLFGEDRRALSPLDNQLPAHPLPVDARGAAIFGSLGADGAAKFELTGVELIGKPFDGSSAEVS
jgi:hypothetical protein